MKRIILFTLLSAIFLANSDKCQAQFLKKLAKGIENVSKKIDETLGTDTKSQSQPRQEQTSTQSAKSIATVKQEAKVIKPFISQNTKTILLDKIGRLADFQDGLAFVEKVKDVGYNKTSTWGVIDTEGNIIVDFVIDLKAYTTNEGPYYNSGVCVLSGLQYPPATAKTADMLVVDKRGKVVKTLPDAGAYTQFKDSIAHVRLTLPDPKKSTANRKAYFYRFAYVDTKGNSVYPHLSADVYPSGLYAPQIAPLRKISQGLRAYWSYKTGWGFIDRKGNTVGQPIWRAVHDFSDGMSAVQNWEEKWGFIDRTGKLVIDCIFTNEPQDFHEGLAVVKKRDDSWCFIEKNGNAIDQLGKYKLDLEVCQGFIDGKALVGLQKYDNYGSTAWVALDRNMNNFKIIGKSAYGDKLVVLFSKLAAYRNGLYYFTNGTVLNDKLETVSSYSSISGFDNFDYYTRFQLENGLVRWRSENNLDKGFETCYVDRTGEVRILFKEPEF